MNILDLKNRICFLWRSSLAKPLGIPVVMAVIALCGLSPIATATPVPLTGPSLSTFASDDAFLDYIEQTTFQYFWNEAAPNGLIMSSSDANLASPTSTGLALSAYNIAIERGWITRSAGAARVLTTLQTFWNTPQSDVPGNLNSNGSHGFYYNRLDPATGHRNSTNQGVSSGATSIFLMGVIDVGLFFNNPNDPTETAIRTLSDNLVSRANYYFMQSPGNGIYASWSPETGYGNGDWSGSPQGYYLYLVGMGVPNNPLQSVCWTAWTNSYNWQTWFGYNYVYTPALFQHTYTHCWFDLRGITDTYMWQRGSDYFEDARRATYVMQAYAVANPLNFANYGANEWGFGDSSGPNGYNVFGGPPSNSEPDQGVISPAQVAGAIPFAPEICIPTLKNIYSKYGNLMWTTEGFRDCYVAYANTWSTTPYFAPRNTCLHLGRTLLAIENYRTGSTWKRMKTSPVIQRGLAQAGFVPSSPHSLVPAPWNFVDIGLSNGDAAGYSYYTNGAYQVTGGGTINAGTTDAFQYSLVPASGDCVVQAQITSIGDASTSSSARAGVMIRETLDPGSTHASMLFQPLAANGATFYSRETTGGNNVTSVHTTGIAPPYWVKVTRTGNSFSGFVSADGTSWTQVGATQTINMAANMYMGLAVSSSTPGVPCQSTFTNVTFSSSVQPIILWQYTYFGLNAPNTQVSGDTIINNKAGITNLMAYALGANPNTVTLGVLPTIGTTSVSGSNYLKFNFTRNTAATDIIYTVQGSSDLSNWSTISTYSGGVWTPNANVTDNGGVVAVQDNMPMSSTPKRFMRLQVTH